MKPARGNSGTPANPGIPTPAKANQAIGILDPSASTVAARPELIIPELPDTATLLKELTRSIEETRRMVAEIERSKSVSRRVLDLEVSI